MSEQEKTVPDYKDLTEEQVKELEAQSDGMRIAFEGAFYLEQTKGEETLLRNALPDEISEYALKKVLELIETSIEYVTKKDLEKLKEELKSESA